MLMRMVVSLCCVAIAVPTAAATISALATQAIEVALVRLATEFRRQTGHEVMIRFDTSPGLGRRVAAGETADVIVASASVVDQAIKDGRVVADTRREIGRIALGVATRRGAPQPDITSVDALVAALRRSDGVLYSQGTSGLYIEQMLAKLGLDVELEGKAIQTPSAAVALARLAQGTGNVVAFASISEIRANEPNGVSYVGPLPGAVQNYTTYAAAVMTRSATGAAARDFVRFMTTASAREVMASTGWEAVPPADAQQSGASVPAGWKTYSNPTYRFRVSYPPAYTVAPENESLPTDGRLHVRFQDAALLRTPFGDREPARLSVEVFALDAPIALADWLMMKGRVLPGAAVSRVALTGALEGVRVQSPLQIAPNQFHYFRTGAFVYAISVLGADADVMLASFQFF